MISVYKSLKKVGLSVGRRRYGSLRLQDFLNCMLQLPTYLSMPQGVRKFRVFQFRV